MTRAHRLGVGIVSVAATYYLLSQESTRAQAPSRGQANFEPSQTNPIRLSADGTRLFAVNTDNSTLSVFDVTTPATPKLLSEIPVGLGPVSVNPLSDTEAWVVNQISNSISVVNVTTGVVTDTIPAKPEPMDVVFAGPSQAYVTLSRNNSVAVFNTTTHALVTALPVFGGSPRALAVSPDGTMVYAAFAISGNGTTLIGSALAPPQPPPTNPALPTPPKVGLIVAATDPTYKGDIPYKMPDNDVVAIKTGSKPAISRYYSGVGTINLGLGVNPKTGDLYVANTDALNLTNFEPALLGHWINSRITEIQISTGLITPYDLNPNIDYAVLPNLTALSSALSQPANVVFDPGGSFMYVASFGTDRVAKVNTSGSVLGFTEVSQASGSGSNADPANKRGPRGMALNSAGQTLYVLNRIASTISIINTSSQTVSSEIPVGTNNTPAIVRQGRGFLYDAKLSGNGTGACASCHVDGDMDHLAWNLGNPGGSMTSVVENGQTILFHPMKGPMTTLTLRGLTNLSPYHWRGDQANFAAFNTTFPDLMGGTEVTSAQMTTFSAFVNSILFLPNPYENLNRTLPGTFQGGNPANGETDFETIAETTQNGGTPATCVSCHSENPGPGSNRVIIPLITQPMKVPELRNIYQKMLFNNTASTTIDGFGLIHDGSVSQMTGFLNGPDFAGYTATQKKDITAYSLCFDTGTAPAVGYTRTFNSGNVASSSSQSDWSTLQSQASGGSIDLIARGTIQGAVSGLLYQPSSNNYITSTRVVYTQAQLQTYISAGDTLSFMGVYPGTGSAAY